MHKRDIGIVQSFAAFFLRDSGAVAPGGDAWILSGDPSLTAALKMIAARKIALSIAGMDCRWLRYGIR